MGQTKLEELGYSKCPDGTELTGRDEEDWKREWIVIGYNANLGDPYFVDTSSEQLPGYTAMPGVGAWVPYIVSPAMQNLSKKPGISAGAIYSRKIH